MGRMPLLRLQIHLSGCRGLIRVLRTALFAAIFVICGYITAALFGSIVAGPTGQISPGAPVREIVLVNGPIHYDILVPAQVIRDQMPWLSDQGIALDHPNIDWVVFGWGARDFYTKTGTYADVTARSVWRGITGDRAVMRVSIAGAVADHWPRVPMTAVQLQRLTAAITDSFDNGADSAALQIPGFSEFDRFFPAKGRFHIFNTCNAWVGQMLRKAGLRFGVWTPTPFAVTLSHHRFARH